MGYVNNMARKSLGKGKSPIISIRYPEESVAALEAIRRKIKPKPEKPDFYRRILDNFILVNSETRQT